MPSANSDSSEQTTLKAKFRKLGRLVSVAGDAFTGAVDIYGDGRTFDASKYNFDRVFTPAEEKSICAEAAEGVSPTDAISNAKDKWFNDCVHARRTHAAYEALKAVYPTFDSTLQEVLRSENQYAITLMNEAATDFRSNLGILFRKMANSIFGFTLPEAFADRGFYSAATAKLLAPPAFSAALTCELDSLEDKEESRVLRYLQGDREDDVLEEIALQIPNEEDQEIDLTSFLPSFVGNNFISPSISQGLKLLLVSPSALLGPSKSNRGLAAKNQMKEITPACIAYTIILMMYALSSDHDFTQGGHGFHYHELYYNILASMESDAMQHTVSAACRHYSQELLGSKKRKNADQPTGIKRRRGVGISRQLSSSTGSDD